MDGDTINCPKCAHTMISGFVPDVGHGDIHLSKWHEGKPKKSFWMGTKVSMKDGLPIRAFKCSQCGYLEFYAHQDFKAE